MFVFSQKGSTRTDLQGGKSMTLWVSKHFHMYFIIEKYHLHRKTLGKTDVLDIKVEFYIKWWLNIVTFWFGSKYLRMVL